MPRPPSTLTPYPCATCGTLIRPTGTKGRPRQYCDAACQDVAHAMEVLQGAALRTVVGRMDARGVNQLRADLWAMTNSVANSARAFAKRAMTEEEKARHAEALRRRRADAVADLMAGYEVTLVMARHNFKRESVADWADRLRRGMVFDATTGKWSGGRPPRRRNRAVARKRKA